MPCGHDLHAAGRTGRDAPGGRAPATSGAGFGGPPTGVVGAVLAMRTWAVVGLSDNTVRPAWEVAGFLSRQGKRIVPVHPRAVAVHGQTGYPSLADIPFEVDVVDVFVRSQLAGPVVDEAIAVGARAVWMQLGVVDHDAEARGEAAGLLVVMNRCPKLEWRAA